MEGTIHPIPASLDEIKKSLHALHASNEVIRSCVYGLCLEVEKGNVMPDAALAVLRGDELGKDDVDLVDAVGDALGNVIWLRVQVATKEGVERLTELGVLAKNTSLLPAHKAKELLDAEFLTSIKVVSKPRTFLKQIVRANTKLFLTQQKFNLLREESEGYAKLITDLNSQDLPVSVMKKRVLSLIGYFDLDPNRVIDLILDALEHQMRDGALPSGEDGLLKLLESFNPNSVTQLFGFKFQHYASSDRQAPDSLYAAAAVLIRQGAVSMHHLYPHMSPKDDEAFREHETFLEQQNTAASKISLTGASTELPAPTFKGNQKVGLLLALLRLGVSGEARVLLGKLTRLDPAGLPQVGTLLRAQLAKDIEPFYQRYACKTSPSSGEGQHEQLDALCNVLFSSLSTLGPHVGADVRLFCKVCRLLRELIKMSDDHPRGHVVKSNVEQILGSSILPGLSLLPGIPAQALEVWQLLKAYPYQRRFRLYHRWKNVAYDRHDCLIRARKAAKDSTKRIMRRLSKDEVKKFGRHLGKVSHSSPLVVLATILSQLQTYDNMIGPVVEALKYLTPLAFDGLAFLIVEQLGRHRDQLKGDGFSLAHWLQCLSQFCGALYRKYPSMELQGLVQFIANQTMHHRSLELIVLRELMAKMTGVAVMEQLSSIQLAGLGGAPGLQTDLLSFGPPANLGRPTQKFLECLMRGTALPIMLVLAQLRNVLVQSSTLEHAKLLAEEYDKCHETLLQYLDLLTSNMPADDYEALLPPLSALQQEYSLPPAVCFAAYRPLWLNRERTLCLLPEEKRARDKLRGEKPKSSSRGISEAPGTWDALQRLPEAHEASGALLSLVEDEKLCEPAAIKLYAVFWSLGLYDVCVPEDAYTHAILKHRAAVQEGRGRNGALEGREAREAAKALEGEQLALDRLRRELEVHHRHHIGAVARLKAWQEDAMMDMSAQHFLQHCIYPRVTFSAADSVYCAKVVPFLMRAGSRMNVPLYLDRMFKGCPYFIAGCSEAEAVRFGNFLRETFTQLLHWRRTPETYEKEVQRYTGFAATLAKPEEAIPYASFRAVTHRWWLGLTKSLLRALESDAYMQLKTTLLVLTQVVSVFPKINRAAAALERKVIALQKDKRVDLKTLATRYHTLLQKEASNMQSEEDFKAVPGASTRRGKSQHSSGKSQHSSGKSQHSSGKSQHSSGRSTKGSSSGGAKSSSSASNHTGGKSSTSSTSSGEHSKRGGKSSGKSSGGSTRKRSRGSSKDSSSTSDGKSEESTRIVKEKKRRVERSKRK